MARKRVLADVPPSLKRGVKGVAYALVVSILVLVAAYLYTCWHYSAVKFPGPPPWAISPERVILFLDAVGAGIVAFALLGTFAFLASLRRPEEETLDDRVAYLYSARRDESKASKVYLKQQVTLLGATVLDARMSYTFVEVTTDSKYVRCISSVEMDIVNMMEHDTYRQKMPLRVSLHKLEGFDRDLGVLSAITITPCTREGSFSAPNRLLNAPFRFTNETPSFDYDIDLEIPPGGSVTYEYSWDAWGPIKDENYCGANRFIEKLHLMIANQTGRDMSIEPLLPKHRSCRSVSDITMLAANDKIQLEFAELPPTCDIAFASDLIYTSLGSTGDLP